MMQALSTFLRFVVLWTSLAATLTAGIGQIRFDHLNIADGLSQSVISDIHQDSLGYMWFGTQDGLNKYDGASFRIYKHRPFDPDSLADNFVSKIFEDSRGRLWVITSGILNRFEREHERFIRYLPKSSGHLAPVGASLVFEDNEGRIWVGTNQGGLFMYLPADDEFAHFEIQEGGTFNKFPVTGMVQDDEEFLWVASFGKGLLRIDVKQGRAVNFNQANSGLSSDYVPFAQPLSNLVIDSKNQLWVGTQRGLHKYNREDQDFVRYQRSPEMPEEVRQERVNWIQPDSRGNLWISYEGIGLTLYEADSGFTHYQQNRNNRTSLPSNRISALTEDNAGTIWVGTNGSGLASFNWHTREFDHHRSEISDSRSLSNDHINRLFVDRTETLWIGTNGAGLNTYHRGRQKFRHYKMSDPSQAITDQLVWAIREDAYGQLWVGTRADGIFVLDIQTGTLINRFHTDDKPGSIHSNDIRALHLDRQGRMWVGTNGSSLHRYSTATGGFEAFSSIQDQPDTLSSPSITAISEGPNGEFWVGTRFGLNLFDRETGRASRVMADVNDPHALASNAITSLSHTRDGELWVGTPQGAHRMNADGRFTRFQHDLNRPTTLSHNNVMCIYQARNGLLWIATFGGGLNRLEQDGQFTHFTTHDGLPNDAIYAIVEDEEGQLWLSTNLGLSRFDPINQTFRNYDASDGLQSNEFNLGAHFMSRTGEVYFGGINGFNAFFPSAVKDSKKPPPVAITGFTPLGGATRTEFQNDAVIHLNYQENAFVLQFAALDYTSPHKNQYAFKLEGFDPEWRYVGTQKTASYTNLDGGTYNFVVKATNSDGIWNETGTSVKIVIQPPFWATNTFYGACSLFIVFSFILAFLFQRRRLQLQKEEALRALELARKTDELEYARKVQLSMLPAKHYQSSALEVWGTMKTATEVGGDYFDFFQLDEHRVAVALGDATGHGMAAGVVVGMVKMATTVWSLDPDASLSETMQRLNLALKRSISERGMGMGLTLAILDTRDGKMEMVSSGMPYPYHFKRSSQCLDSIVQKGPPLGFFEHIDFRPKSLHLGQGDLMIFVSDGLTERFNHEDQIWGSTRLEQELRGLCHEHTQPTEICDKLLRHCDLYACGRKNDDDMTVLVLHFKKLIAQQPSAHDMPSQTVQKADQTAETVINRSKGRQPSDFSPAT